MGNAVSIGCLVSLEGVTTGDVNVVINWMVNGSTFTGDPERVTISQYTLLGTIVSETVDILSLQQSDSGTYTCEAVVTPVEGEVPPIMASIALDMTVISESLNGSCTLSHIPSLFYSLLPTST